jgi:hypothetical protein
MTMNTPKQSLPQNIITLHFMSTPQTLKPQKPPHKRFPELPVHHPLIGIDHLNQKLPFRLIIVQLYHLVHNRDEVSELAVCDDDLSDLSV